MIYAIVPVKHLSAAKRRLARVLTLRNRKLLTLAMLEDVLNAIRGSHIKKAIVVGSDSKVRELAENACFFYKEENGRGLNQAIAGAIDRCIEAGADAVLILPADIPLLSSGDINRIIAIAGNMELTAVLSPSNDGGTNALYMRPPDLIPVNYGPGSFKRHIHRSRTQGARLKVYFSPSVALDIDDKEDLQRLIRTLSTTKSSQFVCRILREYAT